MKKITTIILVFTVLLCKSQTNTTAYHCLGNGNYCVYEQGIAIKDLFGPYYSSPSYITADLKDKNIQVESSREKGTAIWNHLLKLNGKTIGEVTDFVDSKLPVMVRKIKATASFTFVLNIWNYPEIKTLFNANNYTGKFSGALLIHKDRGMNIMQSYAHPYEQFHQILLRQNATVQATDKSDFFEITVQPGESEVFFIGGPDYGNCIENTKTILSSEYVEFYTRTKEYWNQFTARRKDFNALIPESNTNKKQILNQIDNVSVLLKTQQASEGAVLAGTYYHMAYVRDQYGVSRGFLSLGYYEEARSILEFYWGIWQKFGLLHNAQAIGVPGVFHIHENDEVEQTGYLIIQAFDYIEQTNDKEYIKTILPMLQWAWKVQKKHIVKNMLPFNGDETYVAGGILPRTSLNDGSAESTLLFIKSGELLLSYLRENKLWNMDSINRDMKIVTDVKINYASNFIKEGKLITNNPDRISVADMPMFRNGVCMGGHGVVQTQKDKNGFYLCPICFSDKKERTPIERTIYFLPSIALTPVFMRSDIIPAEVKKNIDEIKENYKSSGTITSRPGVKTVIGYEYGYLLFAFSKYKDPIAEKVFNDMMSVVDNAGAWVEYYEDGKAKGCPYRPWESAINIAAIIQYVTQKP